jgi:hypothetical protein
MNSVGCLLESISENPLKMEAPLHKKAGELVVKHVVLRITGKREMIL